MHAAFVARQYGIAHVLVPAFSSAFSALGCVAARMSYSRQRTINMRSADWSADTIATICEQLREEVAAPMRESGHAPENCDFEYVAMARYRGQSYDVPVPRAALHDIDRLSQQFFARHQELFGFVTEEPWELAAIRATITESSNRTVSGGAATPDVRGKAASRQCYFRHTGWFETPVYSRNALLPGQDIGGPAIIEDEWSTIVVPPLDGFHLDSRGHIHIMVGEKK